MLLNFKFIEQSYINHLGRVSWNTSSSSIKFLLTHAREANLYYPWLRLFIIMGEPHWLSWYLSAEIDKHKKLLLYFLFWKENQTTILWVSKHIWKFDISFKFHVRFDILSWTALAQNFCFYVDNVSMKV